MRKTKKAKTNYPTDDLRQLPDAIVKHLFRFFKPSELAKVKLTARRYNELGKQVEAKAAAVLLSQFDDEAKIIESEATVIGHELRCSINLGHKKDTFNGLSGYDNNIKSFISEAKKHITSAELDEGMLEERLNKKMEEWLKWIYKHYLEEAENEGLEDYIDTGEHGAQVLRKYFYNIGPFIEKLTALAQTYNDHYFNSTLQESETFLKI